MTLRRVFAVVPDCHAPGSRFADLWRRHFYEGLRGAGLHVTEPQNVDFGWARPPHLLDRPIERQRLRASRELLRQIEACSHDGLDAVLSCCFSHDVEPELVDRVRDMGIPWINFFCDSAYAFHTVEALARRTSLNWFVAHVAEPHYRSLGVPYLRAPYALNPDALPDASCTKPERSVAFVGAAHGIRVRSAAMLRLAGVDLHVAGPAWPDAVARRTDGTDGPVKGLLRTAVRKALQGRLRGHLDSAAFLEYLRTSQILLGLNRGGLGDGPYVSYLKLRDVEFPGMGCCYLVEENEDVADCFEAGTEVVPFGSVLEARREARALSRDPAECRRIGRRARDRVLQEHTWAARIPQLVAALE